ncbi:alpha/beta-hydrolase, partial [Jaminaea rosea]
MIDHLLGRPSTSLKRLQVLAVLAFWGTVLNKAPADGPRRFRIVRWASRRAAHFPPWKIVLTTLMFLYSLRHIDSILGFGAPEPLARMYSRSFYRVTWIVTALDAGFATALNVKPKWLRDILSMVFSAYYVLYANEADEKLRKHRAFCTLEMLRYTWEKTTNPYIRLATWIHRPSLPIARPILLPRPTVAPHNKRPIKAWLFYARGREDSLAKEEELYLDFPGGGFICMTPQHHEERLRQLAKEVHRPILALDYCKAPEYPYPFALEECFDAYRTLVETRGKAIGMSGSSRFRLILSGDSAGGNLASGVMFKILEYPQQHIKVAYASLPGAGAPPPLPKPLCMILAYPSLNFGFTAWMKPEHLRVLKAQSEVNLQSLQIQAVQAKEDAKAGKRGSPLRPRSRSRSGTRSRKNSLTNETPAIVVQGASRPPSRGGLGEARNTTTSRSKSTHKSSSSSADSSMESNQSKRYRMRSLASQAELHLADRARLAEVESPDESGQALLLTQQRAADSARLSSRPSTNPATRLTMSSMSGYFQDRILTQSMMRAMAILYIGPRLQPDFERDYYLSPVVAPRELLAEWPPVLMMCGEKDPICDDTVVMAGRIREAKLAKQAELIRRRNVAGAPYGESLRMSTGAGPAAGAAALDVDRDPLEEEDVDDWVQMRIVAEVSHGFLQMSALWPEAKHIISFISAWCVETFDDEGER